MLGQPEAVAALLGCSSTRVNPQIRGEWIQPLREFLSGFLQNVVNKKKSCRTASPGTVLAFQRSGKRENAMKHPVDAHVGKRIRHRRWMVGMTQQQLADRVGIKFQQIQKYETGMNRVSASRLYDISREMDVPVAFFFEGLDSADTARPAGDLLGDKEAMDLIRAYYSIPEAQRRRLFDLARVLSDTNAA
jgi:transcriptional regulator with XRE-family HTH domain